MYDDDVLMGELAYDFLAREANSTSGQSFPDSFVRPPLSEDAYRPVDFLCPIPGYAGYSSASSDTTYVSTLTRYQR